MYFWRLSFRSFFFASFPFQALLCNVCAEARPLHHTRKHSEERERERDREQKRLQKGLKGGLIDGMDEGDGGWEELRKEARKVEGDLDVKLSSYNKLGGMLAHGGFVDVGSGAEGVGGDGSWKSMEMEIESLLEKLLDINDAMSRCVAAAISTTSVTQKLARHRDILHEFTQEFRRTKNNISLMREHAELLTSVRNDISEYKASGSLSPGPSLLRERGAIHGNILQVDEVINQAQATKGALAAQRSAFMEIQGKLKQLADRFPVVRGLLGAIKRKRSKDTLILAGVITACSLFLIIYWISK